MATTLLRTRVDSARIRAANKIFADIGLKPADAVNIFLAQVIAHQGIPFAVQREGYTYAAREYGITPAETDAFTTRVNRSVDSARKAGKLTTVKSIADLRA